MKTLLIIAALMVSGCKFGADKAKAKVEEKKAVVVVEAPKQEEQYEYCGCFMARYDNCDEAGVNGCYKTTKKRFDQILRNKEHICQLNKTQVCVDLGAGAARGG